MLSGNASATGWEPPAAMSREQWLAAGAQLARVERGSPWWVGDWWNAGVQWGEGAKACEEAGIAYQTARNYATVCSAFPLSRRRDSLTFGHHAEVCAVASRESQELLLDWCEAPLREGGRARSVRELRLAARPVIESGAAPLVGSEPPPLTCAVKDLGVLVARGLTFGVLYADPPWAYENQGTRAATDNHYVTMGMDELLGMGPTIRALAAEPSYCFLWVTATFLAEGLKLLHAWGYEYKTHFVWCKPQIGLGNYVRTSHEPLLIGVRGGPLPFCDKTIRSWDVYDRGEHSAKPGQVRAWIERVSPAPLQPRLELFARAKAHGWVVWGNDVGEDLFTRGIKELRDGDGDAGRQGQPDGREVPDDRP